MKPYLYFDGLLELVQKLKGTEVVHVGIRPYGFHAGNVMVLVVYPYLFCKYFKLTGKIPKFKFVVSINDWEQDHLDGPDPRRYPFNVLPKSTSIYYTPDEKGCCKSSVDHWEPVIKRNILIIQKHYPQVSFDFVRNSELSKNYFFTELLLETIRNPREQFEILKANSKKETLDDPIQYAGAVCPKCFKAIGKTNVIDKNNILLECYTCKHITTDSFDKFQYWWYHKPMLIARMKIFKIDVTLSGGDHFIEGDFDIRKAFLKKYTPKTKEPYMLFTPTVLAFDGQKMSKSRNNTEFADILRLIKAADGLNKSELKLTEDLVKKNIDEKDYSCIF